MANGKRRIRYLIVHHSLGHWGDGGVVVGWHTDPKPKGNGWENPGYHVVIENGFPTYNAWSKQSRLKNSDGKKDCILSEDKIAPGCKYGNSNALHVCLIGDFDKYEPTNAQKSRLISLLVFWCKKYGLNPLLSIRGHGEMQLEIGKEKYQKTCPGKLVDMNAVRMEVYSLIK